jgi:hypothetical protein
VTAACFRDLGTNARLRRRLDLLYSYVVAHGGLYVAMLDGRLITLAQRQRRPPIRDAQCDGHALVVRKVAAAELVLFDQEQGTSLRRPPWLYRSKARRWMGNF